MVPAGTVTVTVGPSGGVPQAVAQRHADRHGVTGATGLLAAPFRVTQAGRDSVTDRARRAALSLSSSSSWARLHSWWTTAPGTSDVLEFLLKWDQFGL